MGVTNFDSLVVSGLVYSLGAPLLPSGMPFTTGRVLYVNNAITGASDNNDGTVEKPMSTVDAAIGKCVANAGDLIILGPGHAETVTATSIALDVAGVTIVGVGNGLKRPTFTFGAAAATITVSAANCTWRGCHFIANFVDVAAAFTVGAAKDFVVGDSSFVDTSSILNFLSIVVTGASNNAADGLGFVGNTVYGLAATDGAVVSVLGNLLRLNVSDNVVDKAATNDAGHLITMSSKVCGGVRILRNILTLSALASQSTGTLFTGSSTTSSGICAYNLVNTIDTSASIIATTGTKISFNQNFMSGAADASGIVWPAGDTPS